MKKHTTENHIPNIFQRNIKMDHLILNALVRLESIGRLETKAIVRRYC